MNERAFFTGNWFARSPGLLDSPVSAAYLDLTTLNSPSLMPHSSTFGRKTPESLGPNSSWDNWLTSETPSETGTASENWLKRIDSMNLTPERMSHTTEHLKPSLLITSSPCPSRGPLMSFGAPQEPEKVVVRGLKRASKRSRRIRGRNSGAVTRARLTWLSMSFEEALMLGISCGGSIATPSLWKSKEEPQHLKQHTCGLPLTWILGGGTQTSINQQLMH